MTNEREEEEEEEEENILLSSAYVERILNFVAASIVSVRVAEWITLVITIDPVALPLSPLPLPRVNVSNYVWPGKVRQLLISRYI